jgi:tetratricopeptide (TPR) repeat protein
MIALSRGATQAGSGQEDRAALRSVVMDMERPRVRIGLWPLVSEDAPEVAMGVMTLLAFLLERYQEVSVYRLFAQLEGDPADYIWTIEDSQFAVDDWQLDDLDENVGLWGTLEETETGWTLTLEMESDFAPDDEPQVFTFSAPGTRALVNLLPQISDKLAAAVDATTLRATATAYKAEKGEEALTQSLLKHVFLWEKQLVLALWGVEWPVAEAQTAHDAFLHNAEAQHDELSAWVIARATARGMSPLFDGLSDMLVTTVPRIVNAFRENVTPTIALGMGLSRLGNDQEAYELLEDGIDAFPESEGVRFALAAVYRRGGRVQEAVDTLQDALNAGMRSVPLALAYADLLNTLRQSNLTVPEAVYLKGAEREPDFASREASAAYHAVFELDPKNADALSRELMLLVELGEDERLWPLFEQLVALDASGEAVRAVAETFATLDDPGRGIEILEAACSANPDRADLHLSLAVVYLANDQAESALAELEQAEELTDDDTMLAEIERLMLAAEDPEFEMRMGEITEMVNSGRPADTASIDYLEEALEAAPSFAQGYLLLGRAYASRGEAAAALETLLDGQKYLPDDPDILEALARVLWEADERDLAFDYLNKGLARTPDHVPLLALAGRCLFETGQEDEARSLLGRAESIMPRHPALLEARLWIAQRYDE